MAETEQKEITFRVVRREDKDLLLQWRNDPLTWRYFLDARPVDPHEHARWFEKVLAGNGVRQYVVLRGERPVGQVRYDIQGDQAIVSITIASESRGAGIGADALKKTGEEMFHSTTIERITALVRADNAPSVRVFSRSGYRKIGSERHGSTDFLKFVLIRAQRGKHD